MKWNGNSYRLDGRTEAFLLGAPLTSCGRCQVPPGARVVQLAGSQAVTGMPLEPAG